MTLDADPDKYPFFSRRWWRAYWRMLDERARLNRRRKALERLRLAWLLVLVEAWRRLAYELVKLALILTGRWHEPELRSRYDAPPVPAPIPPGPPREIAPSALGQLKDALDFLRFRTGRSQRAEAPILHRLPPDLAQHLDAATPAAKGRMRDEAEAVYRTAGEAAARRLLDEWRAAIRPQDAPPAGGAQGIDHRPRRDPDHDEPGHRPGR